MVELGDGFDIEKLHERAKRVLGIVKEDSEAIGRSVKTIGEFRSGFKKLYAGDNHELMRVSRMRVPT
jgi:hypothetical protein